MGATVVWPVIWLWLSLCGGSMVIAGIVFWRLARWYDRRLQARHVVRQAERFTVSAANRRRM